MQLRNNNPTLRTLFTGLALGILVLLFDRLEGNVWRPFGGCLIIVLLLVFTTIFLFTIFP